VASTSSNTSGPTTNKRSIESTVLVDDGRIVGVGRPDSGRMSRTARTRCLCWGIFLYLGNLFKYDTRHRVKTNLMVFLRPYVLKDVDSSASVTGNRYEYIRGQPGSG